MNIDTRQCMGGWCKQRNRCANYHAPNQPEPADRLCPKGEDFPLTEDRAKAIKTQPADRADAVAI